MGFVVYLVKRVVAASVLGPVGLAERPWAVLNGLGIIDEYIVPHADVPECLDATNTYRRRIEDDGRKAILLNQLSAMAVDGAKTVIMP